MNWSIALAWTALLVAGAGLVTGRRFAADMKQAHAKLLGRSELVESHAGRIEYAAAGSGPTVLMIHGSGGGFDQGLAFARPLIDMGYRIIAPSRFGYLRSSFPPDPSPEAQADIFAQLLDILGINRLPVIGGSAGALSAIAFAIRHPDRCSALLPIVPAAYAPDIHPGSMSPLAAAIMRFGLRSDFLFWLGLLAAPRAMTRTLLATDPRVVTAASPDEQARVKKILWDILPVSARVHGLMNDTRLASHPLPMALDRITAPTLTISLADDRFGTFAAARHIAANVRGARMVSYPTGGHVWVGHQREMFAEIDHFLRSL